MVAIAARSRAFRVRRVWVCPGILRAQLGSLRLTILTIIRRGNWLLPCVIALMRRVDHSLVPPRPLLCGKETATVDACARNSVKSPENCSKHVVSKNTVCTESIRYAQVAVVVEELYKCYTEDYVCVIRNSEYELPGFYGNDAHASTVAVSSPPQTAWVPGIYEARWINEKAPQ